VVHREVGAAWWRETWAITGSRADTVFAEAWLADEPGPVVVVGHGAESDRRSLFISGTGKGWTRYGLSVVAADAPCHGDRVPAASPRAPFPSEGGGSVSPRSSRSGGGGSALGAESEGVVPPGAGAGVGRDYLEWWVADHLLVVGAAQRRLGRFPVGYLGLSMGAVLGVHLVAAEPRIAAAVFAVGGSFGEPVGDGSAGAPAVGWLGGANPEEAASRLGDRPVLMVQADEDEVFSRESAFALYGAFPGRKEISFFPGTHSVWRHPGQWNRRMLAFFRETLRV
jgi:hypothetical protein